MLVLLPLLLLLAACSPPPPPSIPPDLRACPGAAEAPPKLGRIVTPEALRARYYAERAARLETQDALETCAGRLARLLEIMK
jgi:hypothetical protein